MGKIIENKSSVRETDYVIQDNKLVESRLCDLGINEQKIIMIAMSQVKDENNCEEKFQLRSKEVLDLIGLKENHSYIRKIAKGLNSKPLEFHNGKSFSIINWFSSIEYIAGEGIIEVEFGNTMLEMIKNMKKNFTAFQLAEIMDSKCVYSIKIFQLLSQYKRIGKRFIPLQELRLKLGLSDKSYRRIDNFKRRVLGAAQADMELNSSIKFNYKLRKEGVKIIGIDFQIYDNKSVIEDKLKSEISSLEDKSMLSYYKIVSKLNLYGITDKKGFELVNKIGEEALEEITKEVLNLNSAGAIDTERIAGAIINMVDSKVVQANSEAKMIEEDNEIGLKISENMKWVSEREGTTGIKLIRYEKSGVWTGNNHGVVLFRDSMFVEKLEESFA